MKPLSPSVLKHQSSTCSLSKTAALPSSHRHTQKELMTPTCDYDSLWHSPAPPLHKHTTHTHTHGKQLQRGSRTSAITHSGPDVAATTGLAVRIKCTTLVGSPSLLRVRSKLDWDVVAALAVVLLWAFSCINVKMYSLKVSKKRNKP